MPSWGVDRLCTSRDSGNTFGLLSRHETLPLHPGLRNKHRRNGPEPSSVARTQFWAERPGPARAAPADLQICRQDPREVSGRLLRSGARLMQGASVGVGSPSLGITSVILISFPHEETGAQGEEVASRGHSWSERELGVRLGVPSLVCQWLLHGAPGAGALGPKAGGCVSAGLAGLHHLPGAASDRPVARSAAFPVIRVGARLAPGGGGGPSVTHAFSGQPRQRLSGTALVTVSSHSGVIRVVRMV